MKTLRLASGLMLAICCSLAGTGRAEVVLQPLDGSGKQGPNLVPNGGFEEIADNMPAGWKSQFPSGPTIDRQCVHGGKASLRFTKPDASTRFWVSRTIEINQQKAAPLVLSGWSKAEAVTGTKSAEYSVWVDLQYADGTSLFGQRVLFDVGTHDWQHVEFPFVVAKPVKLASVSVLFRGAYAGTVWFDDVSLTQLDFDAGATFDGGPVAAVTPPATPPAATVARVNGDGLTLGFGPGGQVTELTADGESILGRPLGGFWVRDVARGGPWLRMLGEAKQEGGAVRLAAEEAAAGLRLEARLEPAPHSIDITALLRDTSGADRAVTVCFVLPLADQPRVWHDDILRSTPVAAGSEYKNAQSWPAGASLSAYPFSSLTSERLGLSLAAPMDCPRVCRFVYNSWLNLFYAAYDFGLAKEPRKYPSSADFRLSLYRHEPAWGFRAAAAGYYDRFPQFFQQRLKRGGIWMAFADISKVEGFEDFGFAYDELGGNHRAFDDAQKIASFHYLEPMTHWLAMDKKYPRTYDGALAALADAEASGNGSLARLAKITRRCGVFTAEGRYDLSIENQSWCDGAVFTLNPDPNLPEDDACPVNKAHLGYTKTWADKNLGETAGGGLYGVYIDSMPNWGNVRNWRREHWQTVDSAAHVRAAFQEAGAPADFLHLAIQPVGGRRRPRARRRDARQRRRDVALFPGAARCDRPGDRQRTERRRDGPGPHAPAEQTLLAADEHAVRRYGAGSRRGLLPQEPPLGHFSELLQRRVPAGRPVGPGPLLHGPEVLQPRSPPVPQVHPDSAAVVRRRLATGHARPAAARAGPRRAVRTGRRRRTVLRALQSIGIARRCASHSRFRRVGPDAASGSDRVGRRCAHFLSGGGKGPRGPRAPGRKEVRGGATASYPAVSRAGGCTAT